jgi:hypothetical protein
MTTSTAKLFMTFESFNPEEVEKQQDEVCPSCKGEGCDECEGTGAMKKAPVIQHMDEDGETSTPITGFEEGEGQAYEDDHDEMELDEKADKFEITDKDRMRLEDIIGKAEYFKENGKVPGPDAITVEIIEKGIEDFKNGEHTVVMKAKQLAQQMANAITDVHKALRRARAAEDLKLSGLATIFHKKQFELQHK